MKAGIYIDDGFSFVIVHPKDTHQYQTFEIFHRRFGWKKHQFDDATVRLIEYCCEYKLVESLE